MMRRHVAWMIVLLAGAAACARPVPPAMPAPPRVVDLPGLEIPAGVVVTPEVEARHTAGWRRFQAGDLRGATREYSAALALKPDFFPSQTGMGYIAFQEEKWQDAARWFDAAIAQDTTYIPALSGRVETSLSLKDDLAAIRTHFELAGDTLLTYRSSAKDGGVKKIEVTTRSGVAVRHARSWMPRD